MSIEFYLSKRKGPLPFGEAGRISKPLDPILGSNRNGPPKLGEPYSSVFATNRSWLSRFF